MSDLFCFFLTIVRSFWFFLVHFSAHVCLRWLFLAHVCFLPLPGLFLPFEYFCSCSFLLLVFLFFVFICLCVRSILHIDAHVCSCLPNFALCSSLVLFCRFCIYIYNIVVVVFMDIYKCKYMPLYEMSCVFPGRKSRALLDCQLHVAKPLDDTAVILAAVVCGVLVGGLIYC